MQDIEDRIRHLADELRAHSRVHLVCDGKPVPPEAIDEYEAKLGAPLDPSLKAFYSKCNGSASVGRASQHTHSIPNGSCRIKATRSGISRRGGSKRPQPS